jgi:Asp-tRNA(Asn)/Glu-tRNA(Gln) amidotransferase A subunit family amidase
VRAARAALPAFFGTAAAIIVPAAPGEAPAGLERTGDPIFNRSWTALGLPCITLPTTRGPAGLPLGLQLVAPLGADAQLLCAAAWVEQALAG